MLLGTWKVGIGTLLMRKGNYFLFDLSIRSINPDSSKEKLETFPGYTMRT